jgi:hypothetical protein
VTQLEESGLGKLFWLFSFCYTLFWRNRQGVPTPYLQFFRFEPHLPARYPFGCLVVYLRYDSGKGKLDSRSRKGIYLGPVSTGKGSHHILSIHTQKVVSRSENDCEFFPLVFPRSTQGVSPVYQNAEDDDDESSSAPVEGVGGRHAPLSPKAKQERGVSPEHKYVREDHELDSGDESDQVPSPEPRRGARLRSAPSDEYAKFLPSRRVHADSKPRNDQKVEVDIVNFTVNDDDAPQYREAMASPDRDKWLEAIDEELANQQKMNTYKVVKTPAGTSPIPSVWVLKKKRGRSGVVTRSKC